MHTYRTTVRGFVAAWACTIAMSAVAANAPTMQLESSVLSGSGKTLQVTRVPVTDSKGDILYKDVTIKFDIDNSGGLSLTPDSPRVKKSLDLDTAGFRPGFYQDPKGYTYRVSGPGVLTDGRTAWALDLLSKNHRAEFTLSWATGPVKGHPNEASLAVVRNIEGFSWGLVGTNTAPSGNPFFGCNPWCPSYIVGMVQLGDQMVVHLFQRDSAEDTSVTLTRCPNGNC